LPDFINQCFRIVLKEGTTTIEIKTYVLLKVWNLYLNGTRARNSIRIFSSAWKLTDTILDRQVSLLLPCPVAVPNPIRTCYKEKLFNWQTFLSLSYFLFCRMIYDFWTYTKKSLFSPRFATLSIKWGYYVTPIFDKQERSHRFDILRYVYSAHIVT